MVSRSLVKFYVSLMIIGSLTALIKSSKTKETEIEKQIIEVLQHAIKLRKKTAR